MSHCRVSVQTSTGNSTDRHIAELLHRRREERLNVNNFKKFGGSATGTPLNVRGGGGGTAWWGQAGHNIVKVRSVSKMHIPKLLVIQFEQQAKICRLSTVA
jgi:hypothetical protein